VKIIQQQITQDVLEKENKMNKFTKIIAGAFLVVGISNAQDIVVSENFLDHPYCDKIKKISLKTKRGTKTTLYEILKKKAKSLGGNAVINTSYDVGFFGTKTLECFVAKCNVKTSPELFAKSSEAISYTASDIKKPTFKLKPQSIFGEVILLSDNVKMDKSNNTTSQSETKTGLGIGIKTGFVKDKFRYYANISTATGNLILASADYIHKLDSNKILYAGLSFGIAQYKLADSSTVNALAKGFQISLKDKKYEYGYQFLNASKTTKVNSTTYSLGNIGFLYVGYHF
jgi:uncharacterized protein YbjQ (UPF0145 family)